jgi:hypothetical protein
MGEEEEYLIFTKENRRADNGWSQNYNNSVHAIPNTSHSSVGSHTNTSFAQDTITSHGDDSSASHSDNVGTTATHHTSASMHDVGTFHSSESWNQVNDRSANLVTSDGTDTHVRVLVTHAHDTGHNETTNGASDLTRTTTTDYTLYPTGSFLQTSTTDSNGSSHSTVTSAHDLDSSNTTLDTNSTISMTPVPGVPGTYIPVPVIYGWVATTQTQTASNTASPESHSDSWTHHDSSTQSAYYNFTTTIDTDDAETSAGSASRTDHQNSDTTNTPSSNNTIHEWSTQDSTFSASSSSSSAHAYGSSQLDDSTFHNSYSNSFTSTSTGHFEVTSDKESSRNHTTGSGSLNFMNYTDEFGVSSTQAYDISTTSNYQDDYTDASGTASSQDTTYLSSGTLSDITISDSSANGQFQVQDPRSGSPVTETIHRSSFRQDTTAGTFDETLSNLSTIAQTDANTLNSTSTFTDTLTRDLLPDYTETDHADSSIDSFDNVSAKTDDSYKDGDSSIHDVSIHEVIVTNTSGAAHTTISDQETSSSTGEWGWINSNSLDTHALQHDILPTTIIDQHRYQTTLDIGGGDFDMSDNFSASQVDTNAPTVTDHATQHYHDGGVRVIATHDTLTAAITYDSAPSGETVHSITTIGQRHRSGHH